MIDILRREGVYLWYYFELQFRQIFGYYLAGMAIGSAISVFLAHHLRRLMLLMRGGTWGALGVIPASAIGIASPLCLYGTIPVAASLSEGGVGDDWLAAFMMSSILLNPQLIAYSAALGPLALGIRIGSSFVCGALAGLLVRFAKKGENFFDFSGFQQRESRDVDPNPLMRLLKNMGRNLRATGPWFLAGIALSALFQRYVPAEWVERLFGAGNGFGVLMAATIGVPLYACGGGTIPLLVGWLLDGMSLGAAAAFMITGPATKITNLGALKIVLGGRPLLLYLLYVCAFALVTGLLVNLAI